MTEVTQTKWKKVRLDECFEIQQGKQVSKNNRPGSNQRPFLRTANVFWGKLDLSELDQMNFTVEEERKLALHKGDLLVCEGGDIGRTAMWNEELEHCYYQNHLHRLRKLNGQIDENFTLLYLQYAFLYARLYAGRANVTTIPNLSKSRLGELEISLPPLEEQQNIARILGSVQKAIDEQKALIVKLKDLKRNMAQHLFSHGTKGEKTKITEAGEVPASWKIIKLKEVCDLQNGYAFKSSDYIDESKTLNVRMSNVKPDGIFDIEYNKRYLPDSYATKYSNFLLEDGDIVIAMTDMANDPKILGVPTIIKNRAGRNLLLNQRLGKLTDIDTNKIDVAFLKIVLTRENVRKFYKSVAKKGVQINLGKSDILSALIALPEIEEQQKIASVIINIDQKTEHMKEKISVYQSLFKTLLHELMSGERKIKI